MREIEELKSNQEETDTRVVLYLNYAVKLGYKSAVVRTPDSDIFFILLHYAHSIPITIYLDTGSGKHRQVINISELAESKGAEYCTALLGLYVFTGEDVTSAFKGKGKVGPLKKLQKTLGTMTRSGKRRFCYVTFLSSTYYLQKDLIFLPSFFVFTFS